ncbi:MAG TPA: xanthine dehydrogenase family protein subunit M [Ilumatobacteraceae bacterium]|nr:xanthine dehydrogenase family protein subunit M [Ilumatobacteraceae bacterium]
MKPPPFSIATPDTLEEALDLLERYSDDGRVLAGGQSLVPLMALRLAAPGVLIDIGRITSLASVDASSTGVRLGAGVRQRRVEGDPAIAALLPIVPEAVAMIGHPTIRNRGTVVGSLCHADPAAELPLVAVALNAQIDIASVARQRTIGAEQFFRGYMTTDLAPTEMAVAVRFARLPSSTGSAFVEVSRRSGDFAMVAAAAVVDTTDDGVIRSARLVLGAVADVPQVITGLDELLVGHNVDDAALAEVANQVRTQVTPPTDLHATAAYRRHMAAVVAQRALATACGRAHGVAQGAA